MKCHKRHFHLNNRSESVKKQYWKLPSTSKNDQDPTPCSFLAPTGGVKRIYIEDIFLPSAVWLSSPRVLQM